MQTIPKDGPLDPIQREQNRGVNRRGFLGMLTFLTAGLAAAGVPVVGLLGRGEGSAAAAPSLGADSAGSGTRPGTQPGSGTQFGATAEATEPSLPIAKLADIPVGGAVNFAYPDAHSPALLVRLDSGEMRAFNNRCTHLECPVYWAAEEGRLLCPCHEGSFDARSGKPLGGPPKRPLTGIRLSVVDGTVYAVGRYGA
jgi:Rieske Fe-S protein